MLRVNLIFALLFFAAFGAGVLIGTESDHAFNSTEIHGILQPGSSREFRFPPRDLPDRMTGMERIEEPRQTAPEGSALPSAVGVYPSSLYKLRAAPHGWTLSIKKQPDIACAVLISPAYRTAQGTTVYALRSAGAIGNTNKPEIFWGQRLLGAAEGLHFLASSAYVPDPELGEVLRIHIPREAVYGYWDAKQGVRTFSCEKEGFVRLRLYGLPYAHGMSKTASYIIPLPADSPGTY